MWQMVWKETKKTKKDLEKDSEIVALNSRFDDLKKLLYAQKYDKPNSQITKSGWKVTASKSDEPWTLNKNNKTWNWCMCHKYWTTGHKTDNCRKGEAECTGANTSGNNNNTSTLSLAINLASVEDDDIFLADSNFHLNDSFNDDLDGLVTNNAMTCTPCADGHSVDSTHLN